MKEIVDNLEEYLSMSKQENLEFLDQLYHLMNQINADAVDYQGLKIHHAPPLCPDCQSNRIVKMDSKADNRCIYVENVVGISE
ncbi:MAG: hypothetical protein IPH17_00670 [Bacteroidales bacterium]|nr:hypothetical protein [Bacteroidales bacterium]